MRALPSGIFIVGTAVCDCVVRDLHQSSPWPRLFARQRRMCGLTLIFEVLYRPTIVHPGTTTSLYGVPVREKSRSWLDNATIVQCQDNHFVDFRLQVTPMSQERPHNLRRRRFLQQTPGEFVPRNLYPFCKLKDLLSRQIPSSEERKQHHEAIGSHKKLQWQALHDCFAVSEFLKRVVAASFFPVGWNRAAVNKPKPTQDFLPAIALRCEPLYPATLDCSDQFAARVTPPAIEFPHLDEVTTSHFCNPNLVPRGLRTSGRV